MSELAQRRGVAPSHISRGRCFPRVRRDTTANHAFSGREPDRPGLVRRVGATHRDAVADVLTADPRKEVIQPQLPLRLPCYDFVPVARPTLGACPSCELAQRLQVLPTPMT